METAGKGRVATPGLEVMPGRTSFKSCGAAGGGSGNNSRRGNLQRPQGTRLLPMFVLYQSCFTNKIRITYASMGLCNKDT